MKMTLTEAMSHPQVFGSTFDHESFWTWKTVARLLDGLPLDQRERELFKTCTGRNTVPEGPVKSLTLLCGRRAGKDRFISAVAVHKALLAADWKSVLSAGEVGTVIVVGADKRQARILRGYCDGLLQADMFRKEVTSDTQELLEFKKFGTAIEIVANDARLIRGRSALAVLGTECCHWRTDESSSSSDVEVVGAAEPSLAMTPGGLLVLSSSAHRKQGVMYQNWADHFGKDDSEHLVWVAPSTTMNPQLSSKVVDDAMDRDPARARAEFLSEWREDLSDYIPTDALEACTDFGVEERQPERGVRYIAFADPSGGTGQDAFTLAVSHMQSDGTCVLDFLRARQPRFVPADVVREFCNELARYGIREVRGDRYAAAWCSSEFERHGIKYIPSEKTRSELYLATLPLLLSKRCRLIDSPTMRKEFGDLERRILNGREVIDHRRSAHDDHANAAAGALVFASQPSAELRVATYSLGYARPQQRANSEVIRAPDGSLRLRSNPEPENRNCRGVRGAY